MMGLDIIKFLWDAGKTAYEIATGLKKKKEEDHKKEAELFEHIGRLLHSTYLELSNGQYPFGYCKQIEVFAESIKNGFKNQLGPDAERLGNLLMTAHEVEQLAGEINNGIIEKKELYKIEESSGSFLAAAKLIMV
jgi:hypothetical protein